MLIGKNEDGKIAFLHGKHKGRTVEEMAESEDRKDKSYLTWVHREASEDLDDDVFHALEDLMEANGIET